MRNLLLVTTGLLLLVSSHFRQHVDIGWTPEGLLASVTGGGLHEQRTYFNETAPHRRERSSALGVLPATGAAVPVAPACETLYRPLLPEEDDPPEEPAPLVGCEGEAGQMPPGFTEVQQTGVGLGAHDEMVALSRRLEGDVLAQDAQVTTDARGRLTHLKLDGRDQGFVWDHEDRLLSSTVVDEPEAGW